MTDRTPKDDAYYRLRIPELTVEELARCEAILASTSFRLSDHVRLVEIDYGWRARFKRWFTTL